MTENYPGQRTEFFIVVGGVTTGPIVGLVELFRHKITPDTPVWYDGLSDWTPAILADVTSQLFRPDSRFYKAHPEALTIMQGRIAGADPDSLPMLVDDAKDTDTQTSCSEPGQPDIDNVPPIPAGAPSSARRMAYSQAPGPDRSVQQQYEPKPSAYLALAIVATILCCIPTGIVAIVYSARVNSLYSAGQIEAAKKASDRAQTWIVVTIVLGLIALFATILWSPFIS